MKKKESRLPPRANNEVRATLFLRSHREAPKLHGICLTFLTARGAILISATLEHLLGRERRGGGRRGKREKEEALRASEDF